MSERSTTHSRSRWTARPRPDARARATLLVANGLLFAVAGTGCVGIGTYTEVVSERDQLAERVRLLEASTESLDRERVELLEGLEDLREERAVLSRGVKTLSQQREELSENLAAREAELAKQNAEVVRLRGTYDSLVTDLEEELAAGQIQIQQLKEGLQVNVAQEILFPSGSARLSGEGRAVLAKVAAELGKLTHHIDVDGHSDNVAIRGALKNRYPTNWELAGARAASVVRLFVDQGIAPERMAAISHADTHPVASNDSAEGRAQNRRIEIRLRPKDGPADSPADSPADGGPDSEADADPTGE